MNLAPIVLLYLFGKVARGGAAPTWPSQSSPPPRRAQKAKPKGKPSATARAHAAHPAAHHAPSRQPEASHAAPIHRDKPAQGGKPYSSLDFSHAPAHEEPAHGKPFTSLDFSHAPAHEEPPPVETHAPVHHEDNASPAATDPSVVPVSQVQAVLRGLGWTGPNTTQGSVQQSLLDGLWGPVTAGDWQRSATKRNLDPAITRLGPTTAHVNPDTFAALREVARSKGAVVGYGRRPLRIP